MTKRLSGKVALVTGGSHGVGASIARTLADDEADVAAFERPFRVNVGGAAAAVRAAAPLMDDGTEFASISPALKAATALGCYGKPEEIAAAVAFLANPNASFITSATLNVEGGLLA